MIGSRGYWRWFVPLALFAAAVMGATRYGGLGTGVATTFVGTLLLAWLWSRSLTQSIAEIAEATKRIAQGDFTHRVYAGTRGKLGPVARALNEMSELLAARMARLGADSEQLRTILGGMVEGVIAIDGDQRIIFVNERAVRLLELHPPVAGRGLWEIVRHRTLQEVAQRALAESSLCSAEMTLSGAVTQSLTVHAARLPGQPGRGAVLVLHDTTELRRLERLRQEFVANVSHELKTPLSVIAACVETLQSGAKDDPEHSNAFLARIAEQTERLHSLILDLLSLARMESGDSVLEFEAVPIDQVATACIARHRARAESQGLTLETSNGKSNSCTAWADGEAVREILDNLVDNALKYTPAGGRVTLCWQANDEQTRIEVADTGMGIPATDLPRIFERFYRVDKARSRELGGTGLGLAIVKHLALAMHGQVSAVSQVGIGSTFTVCLPREASQSSLSLHTR